MSGFIGVVCGLKSEADAVRDATKDDKVRIGISGANAARAEGIAKRFCEEGAVAILSVGVSGGLNPSLKPGDLVVTTKVLARVDGEAVLVSAGMNENKLYEYDSLQYADSKSFVENAPVIDAVYGRYIWGSDDIIQSADNKHDLFTRTKAIAVDMESHGAARAAAQAGVPFIAIRAIADPADRALPPAVLNAVAPDGSTRMFATLAAAMRDPKQFPELMKLGADSAAALKTLRRDLGLLLGRLFLSLDL